MRVAYAYGLQIVVGVCLFCGTNQAKIFFCKKLLHWRRARYFVPSIQKMNQEFESSLGFELIGKN